MKVDATVLIKEYNGIEQQLVPLRTYEMQMEAIDLQVAAAFLKSSRQQTSLKQTQKDETHMEKRVHRNENPRFLHHFVWNRKAKVERLKGELQQLKTIRQDLSNKLAIDSAQLPALQQKQKDMHTIVDGKHQMEIQSLDLFNQVVACQPATQTLKDLRIGEQDQRSLLASEKMLLQAVGLSVQQVMQGLSLFREAEGLYRQAQSIDERAENAKRKMHNQSAGFDFGAENPERILQTLQRQQRELQCQREKAINQANVVAMHAYQVTSTGFATFPIEAKDRYPKVCASIGDVALPRMQGANFTGTLMADVISGTVGAATKDATSCCEIEDHMQVARQCASITSHQFLCMTSMQNAVATNMYQLQARLRNIEQNIVIERRQIFSGQRSAAWWSSHEQHRFAGPKDCRQVLFKKIRDTIARMRHAYIRTIKEKKGAEMIASPAHLAVLGLCLIC